ncbi:Uncharacterised protein [Mycobacteroides abscessus subsp. abscessus]|nr:Uncharacterised protein [Mycobacteroides abscessus subsp. abscessus]SKD19005.1 Uncharacterised protein [Mycobacteroides abscessus subsp. abscessus]SKM53883.1 Uncharacterised protein [Mycobacteroides abscessus subsp. abscessus]SKV75860.1 Uncharacterised protein [Mycobacteroides abscessus subsp. abscessus]SKV88780.1 Uncharacterised protein [Mycobacteroides abscessus subsp. abscessus]
MDPGGKIVVGLPARSTELFERVGDVVAVGFVEILTQGGDFAGGFVDGELACCFVLQLGQQLFEALELIARPIHLGRCVFVRVGVGAQPIAEGADFVVGVIGSCTCPGAFVWQVCNPCFGGTHRGGFGAQSCGYVADRLDADFLEFAHRQ